MLHSLIHRSNYVFFILFSVIFISFYLFKNSFGLVSVGEIDIWAIGETICNTPNIIYKDVFFNKSPFTAFLYAVLFFVFGKSYFVGKFIAILLVIIEGLLFHFIIKKHGILKEDSGWVYISFLCICLCFFENIFLNEIILANLFILLSLDRLIGFQKNNHSDESYFIFGLWLGFSILCYKQILIIVLLYLLTLIFFSKTQFRQYLIGFLGLLFPFSFTFLYFLFQDSLLNFSRFIFHFSFSLSNISNDPVLNSLILGALFFIIVILNLLGIVGNIITVSFRLVIKQLFFFYLIISLTKMFLSENKLENLWMLVIPISYFSTQFILALRLIKWKELIAWIIICYSMSIFFFHKSLDIPKTTFQFKNKRIWVSSLNKTKYEDNFIGGPFWDSNQSKIFKINNYENAASFYELFEDNLPEIIVDDAKIIPNLFDKIPLLGIKYNKVDHFYYLKN